MRFPLRLRFRVTSSCCINNNTPSSNNLDEVDVHTTNKPIKSKKTHWDSQLLTFCKTHFCCCFFWSWYEEEEKEEEEKSSQDESTSATTTTP
jgi:hypothetical protein